MKITPDYTIANVPAAKVIVIPAQSPVSEKTKDWIRRSAAKADVTMSVCTGVCTGKHGPAIRQSGNYKPWGMC